MMNLHKIENLKLFLKRSFGKTKASNNFKKLENICNVLRNNKPFPVNVNLDDIIGEGGFSYVFSAESLSSKEKFAVKIIKPNQTHNLGPTELKNFKNNFYRECIIQGDYSEKHPSSIVKIYDHGEYDNNLFIIMERMNDITLRNIIQNHNTWTNKNKLEIAISLSKKLSRIHEDHLFHRDIKPENILLGEESGIKLEKVGNVFHKKLSSNSSLKYADFGLVKWVYSNSRDNYDGLIVGSPRYRSPEQIETPRFIDHRTDIYSLGLVFCELLHGTLPGIDSISHINATEIMRSKTNERIRSIVIEKNESPYKEHFNKIIRNCLKNEPSERYQNIKDTQKDLEELNKYF